jgi:hypothetical protein
LIDGRLVYDLFSKEVHPVSGGCIQIDLPAWGGAWLA